MSASDLLVELVKLVLAALGVIKLGELLRGKRRSGN